MYITCTICFERMKHTDTLQATRCGHPFHRDCLSRWLQRKKSCPLCLKFVSPWLLGRFYPTIFVEESDGETASCQFQKMYLVCTVCSERVKLEEDICITKCGHVFHYDCMTRWLDRIESCPVCRSSATIYCIYRFYPSIFDEVTGGGTATRLGDDDLEFC